MMDTATIRALADEQAERAAREGLTPYVPWDRAEVEGYGITRNVPFPNIGSHQPAGWELVEHRMVDKSGWGDESEPALTIRGLRQWVIDSMTEGTFGYAIIEEGQFQIVIGRFAKVAR